MILILYILILKGGNSIMSRSTGFLKRSQNFRNVTDNPTYLSILSSLTDVAHQNRNNLPSYFTFPASCNISSTDVLYVLSNLYPERRYVCQLSSNEFICIF